MTPSKKGVEISTPPLRAYIDVLVARRRKSKGWSWPARLAVALMLGAGVAAAALWLRLPDASHLARENPRTTALMSERAAQAKDAGRRVKRAQRWVPLPRISEELVNAVVDSEDARFYEHEGIDVVEVEHAFADALEKGRMRGASTITQQLAKNLWLSEERTAWRKVEEAVLARRLEALGKDRVLELYLNIVEWGDGVYGAEAAAQAAFGKRAQDLDAAEAALLAATLPAPLRRDPRHPSARLLARARAIVKLMRAYGQLDDERSAAARARLDGLAVATTTGGAGESRCP